MNRKGLVETWERVEITSVGDNNGTNKTKEKQRKKKKEKVKGGKLGPSNRKSRHGDIGRQPMLQQGLDFWSATIQSLTEPEYD